MLNVEQSSIPRGNKMENTISFRTKGSWRKTYGFLERMKELGSFGWLDKYGQRGVNALRTATPRDSGLLANSWRYEISRDNEGVTLGWYNDDIEGGCNVAILIEYGHGTRGGTHVAGKHFIAPAIQPIFDEMCDEIGKEMSRH